MNYYKGLKISAHLSNVMNIPKVHDLIFEDIMLYLENCLKKVFQSEVRDCERGMGHNWNSIFALRMRQDYIY
jgi:hypothetical protein